MWLCKGLYVKCSFLQRMVIDVVCLLYFDCLHIVLCVLLSEFNSFVTQNHACICFYRFNPIILACENIVILNYKGISLTTIAALWSAHVLTVSLKLLLHVFLLVCHHRRRTCGAGRRRARQREELFGNSSGILFHIYPYSVHVFHWISAQLIQPTARTRL